MDVFVELWGDCNSQQRPTLNTIGTFVLFHPGPPLILLGRLYVFTPAHPQHHRDVCTVSLRPTPNTIGTFLYCFTSGHPQHYRDVCTVSPRPTFNTTGTVVICQSQYVRNNTKEFVL